MSAETGKGAGSASAREAALRRERRRASHCTACPLYQRATQTVFGEGPAAARILMVGEQPGDREDRTGRPFVGPAGRLLDRALEEAGIDRSEVYVTNAVKHFKWERSGKVRLHKKPGIAEIAACKPWLERELALVQPVIVVALGATAAQTLMGRSFRVTVAHGKVTQVPWARNFMATVHPSSILRAPPPPGGKSNISGSWPTCAPPEGNWVGESWLRLDAGPVWDPSGSRRRPWDWIKTTSMNPVVIVHLVAGLTAIAAAVPLRRGTIKMNPWFGVRIPPAFASKEIWLDLNRYGGRLLFIWGLGIAATAAVGATLRRSAWIPYDWVALAIVVGGLALVVTLIFRRARRKSIASSGNH